MGFLDGYKTYDTSEGFGSAQEWQSAFRQRLSTEEATAILSGQQQTPHQLLGVSPQASQQQIKAAYRRKIMEWHPDRNQHRQAEAEDMSKKIIAAYSLLSK